MSNFLVSRTLRRDDVYVVPTLDGSDTLFSRAFESTYHSINGAVSESRHVFIQHGLSNLLHLPEIHILEVGFGTGLNAFLSYLISQKHKKDLVYTGIESFPIDHDVARQLNYPAYLVALDEEEFFLSMHRESIISKEHFSFKKLTDWNQLEISNPFNCIFFDAFAPAVQSDIWGQEVFAQLSDLMASGGYLVTYCAQGEVRRRIERAGFEVKRIPGAPGKREMIQAIKR